METDKLENLIRELLVEIVEDPARQGIRSTPVRAAKAWRYLARGYSQDVRNVVNSAIFDVEANHMIIVKDIEIYSLCEHHLLPFFGRCHIGYIPRARSWGSASWPGSPRCSRAGCSSRSG